jgi:hypothetical protein
MAVLNSNRWRIIPCRAAACDSARAPPHLQRARSAARAVPARASQRHACGDERVHINVAVFERARAKKGRSGSPRR